MKRMLDAKSLMAGLGLGVLVMFCVAASLKHTGQPGRFQLGVGDVNRVYVIDTSSGQVWEKSNVGEETFYEPKAERKHF